MLQHPTPRLVLASASASRRVLLTSAGLTFEVRPADIDETAIKRAARAEGASAEAAALRLAGLKAEKVARGEPDAVVIGADQILVCDGAWFDKPRDVDAAREQLRALRGRTHLLVTAVVCYRDAAPVWHDVAVPHLTMRSFSEDFLRHYLAQEADAVTGTVGAYRVEARGIQLFEAIEGEQSAVLGLPMLSLLGYLRRIGAVAI